MSSRRGGSVGTTVGGSSNDGPTQNNMTSPFAHNQPSRMSFLNKLTSKFGRRLVIFSQFLATVP